MSLLTRFSPALVLVAISRCLLFGFVLGFVFGTIPPESVAARGHETLTPNEATQIGMVNQWQRSMSIPGGLEGLRDAKIHVDKSRSSIIFEVMADGKVLTRVSADSANRFGQPLGEVAAERDAKMQVYKLKRRGIEATVSRREVPQVRLYLAGKDGTIESHDAETGRLLWSVRHGDERVPSTKISVTNDRVVFVNGADLYVLDSMTGALLITRHFTRVPLTAPTIIGNYVMAACSGRTFEGYNLNDVSGERFTAMVAGLPLAQPTRAPGGERLMWPTDSGFVYSVSAIRLSDKAKETTKDDKARLEFRFPADGLVSSEIAAASGNRFFMATEKGQIYGLLAEGNGSLLWRKSLGEPVYTSPVIVGELVLVQTVYGNLYGFNINDGSMAWPAPVTQVEKILGGNDKQILVRTMTTHLEAIDAQSGSVLMEFMATNIVSAVENPYTDRFYLLTTAGSIQCLRPIESELPKMLMPDYEPQTPSMQEPEIQAEPEPIESGLELDTGANPFGAGDETGVFGGDNPFDKPAADGGFDPFGG